MSRENALWGAPRIHGELLKLCIDVGETSVGNYMVRHGWSRSLPRASASVRTQQVVLAQEPVHPLGIDRPVTLRSSRVIPRGRQ